MTDFMSVLNDAKKRSVKKGVRGMKPAGGITNVDFDESSLGESIEDIRERKINIGETLTADLKQVKSAKLGAGDGLVKSLKGLKAPKVKTFTPKLKTR